ncbi:nucleotide disphospho-sugar-binding domain-containing protein [Plantactinospora endophytica]|nr:nucleotide disphospho-sugar-binding domain-containing protein [Plantactinospora endophytica]
MHGHVNPLIPLVTKLIARGEKVFVAISQPYAEAFREAGCDVTELDIVVPTTFPENPTDEQRKHMRQLGVAMIRQRPRIVEELHRNWESWRPDVVVADLSARWGAKAARKTGARLASFCPSYALSEQMVLESSRRRHGPLVTTVLHRLGLLRKLHPALQDRAELALVNTPAAVQPARETFDDRFRFVGPLLRDTSGYGSKDDLPWDRIDKGPTLFVSPGTLWGGSPRFFRGIADAFAGSKWTVVMATAHVDPAELGELPENVIASRYIPQTLVLPRSDVFVTRTGMNSAMEAVVRGIPLISVPRAFDQKAIAARLAELGVGITIQSTADGAEFREAADRLLGDESVRAALARLNESIGRSDPAADAADALQELAATSSRPSRARAGSPG